jgi:RNA polymerase sigma factor (sigma-70 family)
MNHENRDIRHLRYDEREAPFVDEHSVALFDIATDCKLLELEDEGDFEATYFDAIWLTEVETSHGSLAPFGDSTGHFIEFLEFAQRHKTLSQEEVIASSMAVEAGVLADERLATVVGMEPQRRRELMYLARSGHRAKATLMRHNLALVASIAKTQIYSGLPIMDLVQEGCVGLIRAIEKYDYQLGYAFSTYATWWIRQAITRAIPEQAFLIRLPVHAYESLRKAHVVSRKYFQSNRKMISAEALHREVGVSAEALDTTLRTAAEIISLNQSIGIGEVELGQLLADEWPSFETAWGVMRLRDFWESRLDSISERSAAILRMRFGFNSRESTLDEIGNVLGVTRERIRQLQKQILEQLETDIGKQGPALLRDLDFPGVRVRQTTINAWPWRVTDGKLWPVAHKTGPRFVAIGDFRPPPTARQSPLSDLDALVRARDLASAEGDWDRFDALTAEILDLGSPENEDSG